LANWTKFHNAGFNDRFKFRKSFYRKFLHALLRDAAEFVKPCKSLKSRIKPVIAEQRRQNYRLKIIFRRLFFISRRKEIVSQALEMIFRRKEIVSQALEMISRRKEIIPRRKEMISRA
jgi:hypothetical protein